MTYVAPPVPTQRSFVLIKPAEQLFPINKFGIFFCFPVASFAGCIKIVNQNKVVKAFLV